MKRWSQILEDNQCALSANGTTNISVPALIIRQANKSPALTTTPMANLWGALYMEGIICPREDGRGHVPKHMPPCLSHSAWMQTLYLRRVVYHGGSNPLTR